MLDKCRYCGQAMTPHDFLIGQRQPVHLFCALADERQAYAATLTNHATLRHAYQLPQPRRRWYWWPPSIAAWLAVRIVDLLTWYYTLKRVVGFRRYFLPSWWRDREKRTALTKQRPSLLRQEWEQLLALERKRMAQLEAEADREEEANKRC